VEMTLEQRRALARARARAAAAAATPGAQAPGEGASEPASTPSEPAFERAGGRGAFAAGVGGAAIKGFLGLKQLFGGLDDEELGILKEVNREEDEDPESIKRGAGSLAGNVAMTLAPGVGVGKSAVLPMLAKTIAARSSPVAGAVAAGAATSGLTGLVLNPGEGETVGEQFADKAKKSVEDAALGGLLPYVGRILRKVVTGVRKTPDAAKLLDKGVVPTVQQGAESPVVRFFSGLTAGAVPVKDRQAAEIVGAVETKISGGRTSHPGGTVSERVAALDDLLEQDYMSVLGGRRFPLSTRTRADVASAGSNVMTKTGQFAEEAGEANRIIGNIMGDSKNTLLIGKEKLQGDYIAPLGREAALADNPRVAEALRAAREILIQKSRNARLSQPEQELLRQIDNNYIDLSRLRAVARRMGENEGVSFRALLQEYMKTPGSMNTGVVEDILGPAQRVLGSTPVQYQARGMGTALKRSLGMAAGAGGAMALGAPLGAVATAAAPMYAFSLASQTRPGARAIFGDYAAQKRAAEFLRKMDPYGTQAGFLLNPEDDE
jgi:hypothetical protein